MGAKQQRYMLICFLMTLLSMEALNPFLPLYVKSLLGAYSPNYLSIFSALVISAPMVGMILFSPFWGRMADKYGSKLMVLRAGIALSFCQLLMALTTDITLLILIRFIQGVFAGFITAMQTYAIDCCLSDKKGLMLARLQTAKSLASALGGGFGGFILSYYTYHGLFYLSSSHHKQQSLVSHVSFKPLAIILLCVVFLSQVAKFLPQSIFAFYAVGIGGHSKTVLGLLYAAPAISILLTAELSGRLFDKVRCEQPLSSCLLYFLLLTLFAAFVLLIQYFSHQLWQVLCCRLLWGIVLGALLPAIYTLLADLVPHKGYIIGLANATAKAGNLGGILLGALIAGTLDIAVVFLVMAIVYLSMAFVVFIEMSLLRQKKMLSKGYS